jgi:hypothetical protein
MSFRPKLSAIVKMVRERAADSGNVAFGKHARERLEQRGITDLEAIKTLRIGEIKGDISSGNEAGEWVCKGAARIKGSREIGVVTVVLVSGGLFVKSVEWEDP